MSRKEVINKWDAYIESCRGGCYQWTTCDDCLAFPLGLGCPNPNRKEYSEKEEK